MQTEEVKDLEAQEAAQNDEDLFAQGFSGEGESGGTPPPASEEGAQGDQDAEGEPASEAGAEGEEQGASRGSEEERHQDNLEAAEQGRLRQAQERQSELERQNEELRRQLVEASKPGAPEAPKPLQDVPEDIREDVEAFQRDNPKLAALMVEDSPDGEHLRNALEEFGPKSFMVQEAALRIADRREAQESRRAEAAGIAAQVHQEHFEAIYKAHPDFGALTQAVRDAKDETAKVEAQAKRTAYMDGVRDWVKELPYKEAEPLLKVLDKGTSKEVIALLTQYKEHKATRDEDRDESRRKAAAAAQTPRSKHNPPPPSKPAKGTFAEGWNQT